MATMIPPATAAPTKATKVRPPARMSTLLAAALGLFVATLAAPLVAVLTTLPAPLVASLTMLEPPWTTPDVTVPKRWLPPLRRRVGEAFESAIAVDSSVWGADAHEVKVVTAPAPPDVTAAGEEVEVRGGQRRVVQGVSHFITHSRRLLHQPSLALSRQRRRRW